MKDSKNCANLWVLEKHVLFDLPKKENAGLGRGSHSVLR